MLIEVVPQGQVPAQHTRAVEQGLFPQQHPGLVPHIEVLHRPQGVVDTGALVPAAHIEVQEVREVHTGAQEVLESHEAQAVFQEALALPAAHPEHQVRPGPAAAQEVVEGK